MIKIDIRNAKECNSDEALFISFPFDNHILEVIKSCSTRYWDKNTKEWEVPTNKLNYLLENLQDFTIEINNYCEHSEKVIRVPKGFNFKTKPFNHQIDGLNYGMNHSKWLLGDEQGLGKTKQVIDIAVAKKIQYGYKHCLIICGVNGLKWNWRSEVLKHSDEKAYILGQRIKHQKMSIGSNKDKAQDTTHLDEIPEYFIITNVESLRDKDVLKGLMVSCDNGSIGLIAADEIHKMKNPASQQGYAFLQLHAPNMIAMTGTPLMNSPLDLYIILAWLGKEKHKFGEFKWHYCIFGGFNGHELGGYKNMDELQERLNEIMLRRLKKDELDLPEKIEVDEFVEMSPKQTKVYTEVLNNLKADIDRIKMAKNPLTELIRLRQATGYTGILSTTIQESAKLDRAEEIVADAVENGHKVVIFSNWTQTLNPLYERLKKYNPARITGEVSAKQRPIEEDRFQNDDRCKVILGTTSAMGTGLTLTAGSVEIFLDEPWNKGNKTQAEDRCHRIGTKENITIYTLMCESTIDERVHSIVLDKGEMADLIVDGKQSDARSRLIDFLLS